MSELISMPRTGHEVVMRFMPFLDQMVEEDAAYIRENAPDLKTISINALPEGLPHGVEGVLEAYIDWNARRQAVARGLTPDEAVRQFRAHVSRGGSDIQSMAQSSQMQYAYSLNSRLSGDKVFYVAEALTERLSHTEADLHCAFLRLPFPSFQIIYTSKLAIDLFYNHVDANGSASGPLKGVDYKAPLTLYVTRLPESADSAHSLLITTLHAREITGQDPAMYAMSSRQLNIDPNWTVEEAIRTDWKKLDAEKGIVQDRGEEDGNPYALSDAAFYQEGFAFYRLVMNTILYLTSTKAERESLPPSSKRVLEEASLQTSSKQRKKLERMARFTSDAPFEYLGRSVQPIDFGGGEGGTSYGEGGGQKVARRFLVRGHWRLQAHGKGRKDRKTIYIEPHFKGAEISEVINRPYLVRKDGRKIIDDVDD